MLDYGLTHRVVHPDDCNIFRCHADHYHEFNSDSVGEADFRIVHRNGEERWIAHTCQPVYGIEGQFLGRRASNRDITERKRIEAERERLITELQSAIEQIKTLRGIVPICASCKNIRDDKGYWEQVEAYVSRHTEAQFSHSICPDCMKILYPEFCKDEKTD
jgi:hypothetical protein